MRLIISASGHYEEFENIEEVILPDFGSRRFRTIDRGTLRCRTHHISQDMTYSIREDESALSDSPDRTCERCGDPDGLPGYGGGYTRLCGSCRSQVAS